MKKGVYITLGVIATAGLSYFLYVKIRDWNKEIIKDGSFTIKVSADATTNNPPVDDEEDYSYLEDNDYSEEPAWSSDFIDDSTDYADMMLETLQGAYLFEDSTYDSGIINTYEEGETFLIINNVTDEYDTVWYQVDDGTGLVGWFMDTDVRLV